MENGFPKTDASESWGPRRRYGGALPLRSLTVTVAVDTPETARLGCDIQPRRKSETVLL